MKQNKSKIIIVMGFALFATFFGAGNLIFPPYLGNHTGTGWFVGFIGFFLMDIGLATMAILAVVTNRSGDIGGVVNKIGKVPGKVMLTMIILCIGPGLCIPRTAATTYEMGVSTLMSGVSPWIFGAVFFGIVLALTIRPTKVVDIVGNYLTPLLLLVMVVIIVLGIVHPVGKITPVEDVVPLKEGLLSGYQTMDGIGGMLMTMMLITAAHGYGYTDKKEISRMIASAGMISCVLLMLVYGGLAYLGATTAGSGLEKLSQAELLMYITNALLGKAGTVLLSVIVLLACLTTAIGLTAIAADFFSELTGGKVKYTYLVVGMLAFSYIFSNLGLSAIISISAPILSLLYPPVLVLVILTFFDDILKNPLTAGAAAYTALGCGILELLAGSIPTLSFMQALPFSKYGLGWIFPALLGGIAGSIAGKARGQVHLPSSMEETADESAA